MRPIWITVLLYGLVGSAVMLYLNIKRDEYDDILLDLATLLGWPMILYVIITEGTGAFDIEPMQQEEETRGKIY